MKKVKDVIKKIEQEKAESWSEPEEYWTKFLVKNNQTDIQRIKTNYPQDCLLTVDLKKVFDNKMWQRIIDDRAGLTIEMIQSGAQTLLIHDPESKFTDKNAPDTLIIRFLNVPVHKKLGALRVDDLNRLLGIRCLVKRVTEVRPKITRAVFRCSSDHFSVVKAGYNTVIPPAKCLTDGCTCRSLTHVGARDVLVNRQFAYIQEPLDELRTGGTPSSLKVELLDNLCNSVMVGDRVVLNGVYRAVDKMKGLTLDTAKDVYFDCNNAEVGVREYDDVEITEADEQQILEIAAYSDIFQRVEASIAPSILDMSLLKRAIALLLFEGVTKVMPDGTVHRGTINVLCISDPGMAKTVLLKFVVKVSPRGVFADGTNSTKVGLIAPLVKDELTGQWAVEAGAYMLASGGVLCLDEISQLDKAEMKGLNEATENGEVSIHKAGLNVTVKTSASLLAACNPDKGRFTQYESLPDQIKSIDPSLLSRFDLIVLLQDLPSAKSDRAKAQHITDSHMTAGQLMNGFEITEEQKSKLVPNISPELLRKYVAFARKINPVISPIANKLLVDYYVEIRPMGEVGNTVAVTTRQQPSVIRLAEAHARMRLSKVVEEVDARAAISLFDACLRQVATDPATGKLDVDRVNNVGNSQSRGLQDALINSIKYIGAETNTAREDKIFERMAALGFDSLKVRRMIDGLLVDGKLMQPKQGILRVM